MLTENEVKYLLEILSEREETGTEYFVKKEIIRKLLEQLPQKFFITKNIELLKN